jgi:hypothetical protein
LSRLYGWTSDAGGIRHAIKDADEVERTDAQFMLVNCSAFVNYLFERKARKRAAWNASKPASLTKMNLTRYAS